MVPIVGVKIIDDDNAHFTFEAHDPHICQVHLVSESSINAIVLLEDVHIKVIDVNLFGVFLQDLYIEQGSINIAMHNPFIG